MVSIIFPVKNRLAHVKECLPTFLNQTYKDIEIICVDYNCPQNTGGWVKSAYPQIKVFKAKVRQNEWNLCASRNIGIKEAGGEIVAIFDADTLMEPGFIEDCVQRLTNNNFICGYPIGKLHGCCVISKENIYKVGGYNEFLKGWGFDDQDLINRLTDGKYHEKNPALKYINIEMLGFNESLVDLIRHEDSMRVQYQPYKDIRATNNNNAHIALHSGKFRGLESDNIKYIQL